MSIDARIAASLLVCGLAGAAVAVGCGGSSGPGFASPGESGAKADDADGASNDGPGGASNDGVGTTGDAGPTGLFTSGDASGLPAGLVFPCQPGTYAGTFSTMVTSDAGGLFSLLSFAWSGNLSITLQGKATNGSGEIPEPTLTIAPGAKLSGTDAYGGAFNADLSGQLDCPSKMLAATIANGSYVYNGNTVSMEGTMSAMYDGSMTPPVLSMGGMNVSSPQVASLGSAGTWTATLQ